MDAPRDRIRPGLAHAEPLIPVYIGWDPRERLAANVAAWSLANLQSHARIVPLELSEMRKRDLYWRPTSSRNGQLWDDISDAPMSTEHAIARFLVPHLCRYAGWALFVDGDVLFRRDVAQLYALREDQYAVMVVQHAELTEAGTKKEGAQQLPYYRKNWSSVMLFNCAHPANAALTPQLVNDVPGRDLHRFCWLRDEQVGALPAEWNYLVGVEPLIPDAALVHFTLGTPDIPKYAHSYYADEWYAVARQVGVTE